MPLPSKQLIILTGAGFTQNYGGFLAREMWSRIYNNPVVQNTPRIRELLQRNFNFEAVYSDVFDGPVQYEENEKQVLQEAVERAYESLDDAIRGWVFNSDNPIAFNTYGFCDLLSLFNGSSSEEGFFFTLNQDLQMEREYQYRPPGSPKMHEKFYSIPRMKLERNNFVTLPIEQAAALAEDDINNHTGIHYIKLHGSYGWLSADGSQQMVLGKNKPGAIAKEPLLQWYFDLFKKVVEEGNRKLLIIGYGFGDEHINKILLNGVEKHGLSLYIINPQGPEEFQSHLEHGIYYALPLWNGLRGYFPYSLRQIFPPDQSETVMFKEIKESLLA